jgi:multiple sugar transport system permease protein
MYGYTLGFQYFNMGLASAMIMLFFALVLVLVAFVNWIKRKGEVAL